MRAYYNQAGTTEPTVFAHYLYDASGNRVKKITRKSSGAYPYEITIYIDGLIDRTYKWDGSSGYSEDKNEIHIMPARPYLPARQVAGGDDGSRIAQKWVGYDDGTPQVKYMLNDHLGSSNVVLDSSGGLYNREDYFPFDETSFGGFGKKRYRYSGKEKDEESGLYYFAARYYSPWSCRFIRVDPKMIDNPDLTPYNYASKTP